ncbi:MAG: copper resistance D family protein [Vicinamibacterales bacterium]
MPEQLTLETGPKLIAYLATLVCTGATVTMALAGGPAARWADDSIAGRARPLAVAAGLLAVVALGLRAVAHAVLVAGSLDALDADTLRLVTVESRWGGGWRWQVLTAVAATFAAWRARGAGGLPLLAAAVAAWCVVTPALGHGASTTWQRATHALHLGVSGAWIGTVLVLAWCLGRIGVPGQLENLHAVIRRFSPWALASAAMVGMSGLVLAVTYVGAVDALWTTVYGRWLLAKLLVVAALGACGFGNWRRSRADRPPIPALIRGEAALALLVLVLTAVLTETEHN